MKRLNLFWKDDCLGSIYFPSKNDQVVLDLDASHNIFIIDISQNLTTPSRFKEMMMNHLFIAPLAITYGGVWTEEGFTILKSGDDVKIMDRNSVVIYEFRCDDICIEDEEEFCYSV